MPQELKREEILTAPVSEFVAKLENRWSQGHFLCVGLDPDYTEITEQYGLGQFEFNQKVVDATYDLVCAYKPNSAFYVAEHRHGGMEALEDTVHYIRRTYPGIPVILDAKINDIGSTVKKYLQFVVFGVGADAVTLNPYLGKEAMQSFLDAADIGNIYLVKTSNPGAEEFQDLPVGPEQIPLYQYIVKQIATSWNDNGNCAVVVGATKPEELGIVRGLIGDMPMLIPGLGKAQGGRPEDLRAAYNSRGTGIIANLSRSIIFPEIRKGEQLADAVRREAITWHDAILNARIQG
ncbi:orotidine 5'-phosphate decarboxylase [Candidatus Woesebacteria bacterium RIFCSPHIGHO2_01_FULL_38_9b]|uniref:Orotidine-5'-phosphate decarboxylase n=1 Tax=Candidatus Woesebacteria bacterium RIFCSPHIGHO2_01_FULL_38_9b TaxID=1802493 RepID=A0A1F7Y5C1_9BACT|nr:MAG: orotidine 5'-phosphate decarboxylase [Candidatus Woesebacteria bacterium RIFCSPHIGHO2_01_FULL_38_9b]